MNIKEYVKDVYEDIVRIRREIHRHPEIGMDCPVTSALIQSELKKENIPFTVTDSYGVIAQIKGKKSDSDSAVMLRADMDALCIQENTDLEYKSEIEGKMHACGHDLHTAMLIGSAKVLNRISDSFSGTVRLIFQPGEEIGQGARHMIENGAMENVKMGLGIHTDPLRKVGTINAKTGPDWAAVDHFYISLKGVSAHGATPHKGKDALVAASSLVMNLQSLVSRECNPMQPLVVTVGKLNAGTAYNIIAEEALLEGTCRSFDTEVYEKLPEAFERVVNSIAKAYDIKAELKFDRASKPLINSEEAYNVLKETAYKTLESKDKFELAVPEMIGEDFSEYCELAPCVFAHLGCDAGYPLHSSYINFREEAMLTGMEIEVQFALDALEYLNK